MQGFFFAVGPKTQGEKNSNSRNFPEKLKQFFLKTQKKSEIFRKLDNKFDFYYQNLTLIFGLSLFDPVLRLNKSPETDFLLQKLEKYSQTQGNFPKTQVKLYKNSIYRKVHSPALPPKRK